MAKQSLIDARATCLTCWKTCQARNAQVWAHQHANRNPGHQVTVELGYSVRLGEKP